MVATTGHAQVGGQSFNVTADITLPPVGPYSPPGQPDGPFARWRDLYVAGDSFRQTFARFTALGKYQFLVFPEDDVKTMADGFDPKLDSALWYLTSGLVAGLGGEGANMGQLTVPPIAAGSSNPAGATTTQLTLIRQNESTLKNIWGMRFRAMFQPNYPLFHGITMYRPKLGWEMKDCEFYGFGSGNSGSPPGETFQAQLGGNSTDATLRPHGYVRCKFDGRIAPDLPSAGTPVSCVGWTLQRSRGGYLYDVETHHNKAGSGGTLYATVDTMIDRHNGHDLSSRAVPLNMEQVHNVTIRNSNSDATDAVNYTFSNYNAWVMDQLSGPADGKLTLDGGTWKNNKYGAGRLVVQSWAGSQKSAPVLIGLDGKVLYIDSANVPHNM